MRSGPRTLVNSTPRMTELCSICLAARATIDPPREIESLIRINLPWLEEHTACCASCARRFRRALAYFRAASMSDGSSPPILPTGLRLGASTRFRGKGITVAFLDAGFYAHPDLVTPRDRIREYVDVTRTDSRRADIDEPRHAGWHGLMTSVAACGNGALSLGLYRGIASEAEVVLVQCGTAKRVFHNDIRRGFDWILKNHRRHNIRIVNVSVGGDYEASYLDDPICEGVEAATRAGILVCAAVGNAGYMPRHPVIPPGLVSVGTLGRGIQRPQPPQPLRGHALPVELRSHHRRPAETGTGGAEHLARRAPSSGNRNRATGGPFLPAPSN